MKLPLESVPASTEPNRSVIRSIPPDGVPLPDFDFTATVRGTGCPCCVAIAADDKVVIDPSFVAVLHPSTIFAAFTDPSPLDLSYPGVAGYPGTIGTAFVPAVTSRKKQSPG